MVIYGGNHPEGIYISFCNVLALTNKNIATTATLTNNEQSLPLITLPNKQCTCASQKTVGLSTESYAGGNLAQRTTEYMHGEDM